MKTFKFIDIIISISLILFFSFQILFLHEKRDDLELLIIGYCVTGAWQSISMIVHECMNCFVRKRSTRRIYHLIALCSLITIPASFWLLFFAAGPMAIFYTGMCTIELRNMRRRAFFQLR